MEPREAGLRGMSRFEPHDFKLKAATYLNLAKLPLLPNHFGHYSNRPPGGAWGMGANNKYGCCVLAGAGHEEMVWSAATDRPVPHFSDEIIASQYLELTGGADEGLDPAEVAKWRRTHGIADDAGVLHKIKAYALIDSPTELDYAAYLFGAAGMGLFLPDDAEEQFNNHHVWDSTGGKPTNGHYTVYLGKRRDGCRVVATWGDIQALTDAYLKKYFVGGVCYFSPNYLLPSGLSPEAINEEALAADLQAITRLA